MFTLSIYRKPIDRGLNGHSIYMEPDPPPNLPQSSSPAGAFVQQAHPVNETGQFVANKKSADMQGSF